MIAKLAKLIVSQKGEDDLYEIYKYGLTVGFELSFCCLICFLISLKLHMICVGLTTWITLLMFRSYVGGIHFEKYFPCCICSCSVFTIILILSKSTHISSFMTLILVISLCIILILQEPLDSQHRILDKNEKAYFRLRLKRNTYILLIFSFMLYLFQFMRCLFSIFFCLLIIEISLLLGRIKDKLL